MRAVLDTNILVSSYLNSAGPSAQIRGALEQEAFELVVSEPLLAEYARALSYPKLVRLHRLDEESRVAGITGIRRFAIIVEIAEMPAVISEDPADDMVLATAVADGAAYIVSGDQDLQRLEEHRGISIVPPRLFLTVLTQDET